MAKAGSFVKIDGIDGESTDDKHAKWVELKDWGWGLTQTYTGSHSQRGGLTAAQASFHDVTFIKVVDSASAKLMLACANGSHIPKVTIDCVKATGTGGAQSYFKVDLSDCLISTYNASGGASDVATDTFAVNFAKIEVVYSQLDNKGGATGSVKAKYDLSVNKGE
jgi:type VI secretion system secreted protein Hcp